MRYFLNDKLVDGREREWASLEKDTPSVTTPPYILTDADIANFRDMEAKNEITRSFFGGALSYMILK